MPGPIRTPYADIHSALVTQLTTVTGIPAHRIYLVGRDRVPHFKGGRDLVIRLTPPQPVEGWQEGAGRTHAVCRRVLSVQIRVQIGRDTSESDQAKYLSEDGGLLLLEEQVLDALEIFTPADVTSGDLLTTEPLHWAPEGGPIARDPDDAQWISSWLHFEILYAPALDQERQ